MTPIRIISFNSVFNTKLDRDSNNGESLKREMKLIQQIDKLQEDNDVINLQGVLINKNDKYFNIHDYFSMFDNNLFQVYTVQIVHSPIISMFLLTAIRKSSFLSYECYSPKFFLSPIGVKNKPIIINATTIDNKKIRIINIDIPANNRYITLYLESLSQYINTDIPCILVGDLYQIEINKYRSYFMSLLEKYVTNITYPLFDKEGYELNGTYYGLETNKTKRTNDFLIKSDYIFIKNISEHSNIITPFELKNKLIYEDNRKERATSHFCMSLTVNI